jgi:NAD(P)-dependent dehydrogenase (short-subunit alcohol dehydrogenase family)
MTGRLSGKTAAITGAASGVGRAAALAFAAEGATVAIIDRQQDRAAELAEQLGGRHLALAIDVSDEDAVGAAFTTIGQAFDRLDILYNCAGIELIGLDAPIDRLHLDTWHQTLGTNLTGVFLTCKHALRLMLASHSGSIINCGSPTAISGRGSSYHAYSASKGGIHALTRAMAASYGPHGIRVNCVVPGATRTQMTAAMFEDEAEVQRLAARSFLGRLGEPQDLAGIAIYLASDESSWVTGATFIVDGGIHVS